MPGSINLTDSRTKVELESEKTKLEAKITSLQTKEGADAFVRQRLALEQAYLPKLSASFKPDCEAALVELKAEPIKVVTREIQKIDSQIAVLSAKVKEADDREKELVIDGR